MSQLDKRKATEYTTEGGFSLADDLKVGQWYWYTRIRKDEEDSVHLVCITHLGSNYAQVTYVSKWTSTSRVHFDEFFEVCKPEPNWKRVIDDKVQELQAELQHKIQEATDLYGGLSLGSTVQSNNGTQALAQVQDPSKGMEQYKEALREAQAETLPAIFKASEEIQESLGLWMAAPYLPLKGKAEGLSSDLELIDKRLWAVDLYAGISEDVAHITKGAPAAATEKVHVYQRLRFMDEESLLFYDQGGLDFKSMGEFNQWLATHQAQFFPNPKCVVAFRVRRARKDRGVAHNLSEALTIAHLEKKDELTFLYLRNGENLYCLSTRNDFGDQIFPDLDTNVFGRGEVLYWRDKRTFVTEGAMEQEIEERGDCWLPSFRRFDDDSVYFDDMTAAVAQYLWEHNRVALILQGVFDRSPIFQPHGKRNLSSPEGFSEALTLVYDASKAISPADRPDFEAYRSDLNAKLAVGDLVTGFHSYWREGALDKHGEYISSSYSGKMLPWYIELPPKLCRVAKVYPRKKEVLIEWQRTAATGHYPRKKIRAAFRVPFSELFNVSAYKRGGFKRFYQDPNTRADYVKWAPLLMSAERATLVLEAEKKLGHVLVCNAWLEEVGEFRDKCDHETSLWSRERSYTPRSDDKIYLANDRFRSAEPLENPWEDLKLGDLSKDVETGEWTHIVIERKVKPRKRK